MSTAFRFLVAGSLAVGIAGEALAQAAIDPGRVQQQFSPPAVPRAAPQVTVPEIPETLAPAQAESISVRLSAIRVEGATAYTQDQFGDLINPLLGKDIPLIEVFKLADAISLRYRMDDYLLSRAVVPAQRIENGVLRIQVVEGFVSAVKFEGPHNDLMERMAARISDERPLRGATLERYLLLVNDLPGSRVRAVLAPASEQTGGSELTLMSAPKAVDAYIGFDNRGSRYIGPVQFMSGVAFNDMLGQSERTAVNFYTVSPMDELRYINLTEDLPIGSDGLALSLTAGYSASRPGFTLRDLDTQAIGTTLGAKLTYPLIRSRSDTLTTHTAFHYLDSRTVMQDDPDNSPSSQDRIRALRLGATYDTADTYDGHNILGFEFSHGLYMLNATREGRANPSRPEGRNDFKKLTIEASRRQDLNRFVPDLGLYLGLSAQSALGDALLSSEQFGVGGSAYGRGYTPSEITGDSGFATKVELQYSVPTEMVEGALQFYGFYDFGATRNTISSVDVGNKATLASTGAGVRFDLLDTFSGNVELAQVLTREVATDELAGKEGKPLKIFFSLMARY